MSGLIWVQTVCKSYKQMTTVKELTFKMLIIIAIFLDDFYGMLQGMGSCELST